MATELGALRTRISLDSASFEQSMAGINRQLKSLKQEQKAVTSSGTGFARGVDELRSKSDVLNRTLELQQAKVKELKRQYDESKTATGENSKQTQNLQTQYNKAVAEMNKTENALKGITTEIERQTNPWNQLSQNMTDAGKKMQSVGQSMSDFGRNYSMKVTAPIVAGGTAVFKAAMDFESAFAGVEKTFSGTEEQLADLRDGIRDMAKEIPASTTEIASVAEAAGQLGIEAESIEEFTRTMIDLGEATNMTADVAATEFARFANITQMSQEDFDKLGSSVVALGNSMATTEAEISSMAMRLAAQGSQVGMTEAEIMALAGTMSSLGIEAEAGGTAMTTVLKKIDSAVGESGEMLEAFADAAGTSSEEFAKVWQNEPIKALDMFIKGLASSGEEGENLSAILADLGIKGIRESDTMLRLAGASDILSDAVNTSTDAWEENSALSDEAAQRYATTESQLKIMWNRIKDVGIELGEALVPAVMDAIDAAEPLIQKIEDGAQAFSEMSEEEQQTILKMIGLVAAIGPAMFGLGQLTSGIGGVLKIGGSVASMFGKAGGTGLLGRIGLMGAGSATPVGLAIGGVALLAGGIYALSQAQEDNIEETLKSIESRRDELDALDESIARFEELQEKNKLSTDEVLRYMDIMDELKNAKNEDVIAALTEEQANLLEKSGFTNDEMQEFLDLNDDIVKKTPETTQAISEHGNAYASVLDEVKKLTEAERERLTQDTYLALTEEMDKQARNLEKQRELQEEINTKQRERTDHLNDSIEVSQQIQDIDLEIAEINRKIANATGDELIKLGEKKLELEDERSMLDGILSMHDNEIGKLDKQIGKKQDKLGEVEKELALFDELLDEYASMILYEQGIVAEKGKAVETLQKEQEEIDKAREKLEEKWKQEEISSYQYRIQNEELDEQQKGIDTAKQKLEEMNRVAGRTVYEFDQGNSKLDTQKGKIDDSIVRLETMNSVAGKMIEKKINVKTDPTIDTINSRLATPVQKNLTILQRLRGGNFPQNADGTDYHPGGPSWIGEEGFELVRAGSRWAALDFGLYDLPRGTQVFTHDESKKIIRALNNMPAYASGTNMGTETNRIVNRLGEHPSGDINQYITIHSPQPTSPTENARKFKQASRQLALEWR